jgi:hypothetical protein
MSDLIYSSAVMSLSQTTEFMRNKSIDNTVIHLIVQQKLKEFTIKEAYDAIHSELPIRLEEIEKSIVRSIKTKIVQIKKGDEENIRIAKLEISKTVLEKLDAQYHQLNDFLQTAVYELFAGVINGQNENDFKSLLLDTVTNLMAKYGFAYAGQLAGIAEATEFVPVKELNEICENMLKKYDLPISKRDLANSISFLFDRRDPCLNNLAFSICNRYYHSRLLGLDLPIDFLTNNLYKDSIIFLDTNFIGTIAFSGSKRHNEFREILRNSEKLGIKFAASELTIAEIHARVQDYMSDLELGEDLIPDQLLQEVREDIIQKSHNKEVNNFKIEESENYVRLKEMGIEIIKFTSADTLCNKTELDKITEDLRIFDRKFRGQYPAKDDRALFHDAYHYFLVRYERSKKENTSAWFLTMDHSVVEHAIANKSDDSPPYAIGLLSFLHTLSQFVESQALKGEFADLFGELIAKDMLPRDQLFDYNDLKLLIGFDIKAREIPPEFVRKATFHIKKNILKGGGITNENRAEVIHEFTKYLSTPDQNFIEMQRKFDKKIQDRDDDIKEKEKRIKDLEDQKRLDNEKITTKLNEKDEEALFLKSQVLKLRHQIFSFGIIVVSLGLSLVLWINKFSFYLLWLTKFKTPFFFNLSIQLFIISTVLFFIFPERKKWIIFSGALVTLGSIIGSLA